MNDTGSNNPFGILFVIIVAALVATLGYSVSSVLSPFVLCGAIVFVLYPFRGNPVIRRILWLSLFLFVVWFIDSLLGILAPLLIALALAYMFNPLVTTLSSRWVPRWAASLLVTLGVVGAVVAVILFLVPIAVRQFDDLIAGLSDVARGVVDVLNSGKIFEILARLGIPVEQARSLIAEELSPKLESILSGLFQGLFGFITGISSVILQIINAVIIPFLFFYLSKDLLHVKPAIMGFLPDEQREKGNRILRAIDEILGQYLRGAVIVAIIQGTLSGIVLALIGVDYPVVLGIMTAVLNFIPYVGLITSLVVSCIVALFSGGPVFAKVVAVVVLYLSQKILEATVLGPKIVGAKVGLHPIVLILSLMVFGYFLGFIGMLIAVPTTALLMSFLREWQHSKGSTEQQAVGVEV